ncbi:hypothetical protein WDW89_23820 [Deltaproteobacteria bacterium TL4]
MKNQKIIITRCPLSKSPCEETCPAIIAFHKGLEVPVKKSLLSSVPKDTSVVNFWFFKRALKRMDQEAYVKFKVCKKNKGLRGILNFQIPFSDYVCPLN